MKKALAVWMTAAVMVSTQTVLATGMTTEDLCRRRYVRACQQAVGASQAAQRFANRLPGEQAAFQAGIANTSDSVAHRAYTRHNQFVSDWTQALLQQRLFVGRAYQAAKNYYRSIPAERRPRAQWLVTHAQQLLAATRELTRGLEIVGRYKWAVRAAYQNSRRNPGP